MACCICLFTHAATLLLLLSADDLSVAMCLIYARVRVSARCMHLLKSSSVDVLVQYLLVVCMKKEEKAKCMRRTDGGAVKSPGENLKRLGRTGSATAACSAGHEMNGAWPGVGRAFIYQRREERSGAAVVSWFESAWMDGVGEHNSYVFGSLSSFFSPVVQCVQHQIDRYSGLSYWQCSTD